MRCGRLHAHDGSPACARQREGAAWQAALAARVVGLAAFAPPAVAAGKIEHVLVIYGNDRPLPVGIEADSGLREALAKSDPSAEVDNEYLDVPRFDAQAYHSAVMTFLRAKYSQRAPNMIVESTRRGD